MNRPVALTCGDPAGIGPELVFEAWKRLRGSMPFFVLFDIRYSSLFGRGATVCEISSPADASAAMPRGIPVIDHEFTVAPQAGQAEPRNASAIIGSIARAAEFALSGTASSICTGPVSKLLLRAGAGFGFGGQTEFLAQICRAEFVAMMLESPRLRVIPATRHCSIAEVPSRLSRSLICSTVETAHESLRADFGIADPRISVAGLNPHAGEGGILGDEEARIIRPALERLRDQGFQIDGPLSADAMFHEQARLKYDVAICMYHDQALIPLKSLDFYRGVNVTLGLPIVRTSPDHGTAFDLAGRGVANADSMTRAVRLAAHMAAARRAARL